MNLFKPAFNLAEANVSAIMNANAAKLARHFAPVLRCDVAEPFRPELIGFSTLKPGEPSPSCRHTPQGPDATAIIFEYALWWNGDIEHLYELEHIWLFLDHDFNLIDIAASQHGRLTHLENVSIQDNHPILYCAPGKHAHAANADDIIAQRERLTQQCNGQAHLTGISIEERFEQALAFITPYDQFLAEQHLKALRFTPSFDFSLEIQLGTLPVIAWAELEKQIPNRLREQTEQLRAQFKGVKAVFLDSGDTLIDESTQVFHDTEEELVLSADPIEGGDTLVAELKKRGYLVALVADGREQSFANVHKAHNFWDLFDAKAISEITGTLKPDARIFHEAMFKLGLRAEDADGIFMMGNNLARDIRGANALGMQSVWIDWVDRYSKTTENELDKPDYTVKKPWELLDVLAEFEGR